jgi:hypothetical protein
MAPPSDSDRRAIGADNYPYDASVHAEKLEGLERLRALSDRRLADYLYVLFAQADRNSEAAVTRPARLAVSIDRMRSVALGALNGELGPDARELAAYLLLDSAGRQRLDAVQLKLFADGLRELRRGCP